MIGEVLAPLRLAGQPPHRDGGRRDALRPLRAVVVTPDYVAVAVLLMTLGVACFFLAAMLDDRAK